MNGSALDSSMRSITRVTLAVLVSLAVGSPAFGDVQLSIRDGRVSIVAQDATVRQILTEWAKIGQTTIVNLERIPGGPVTIELENVSEEQALDVLLRTVSGYIVAPRAIFVSNASRFDRIIVMPTSVVPPRANVSASPAFQPPASPYQQSPFAQAQPAGDVVNDVVDEQPSPNVAIPTPSPRESLSNTRQALEVVDPRQFRLQMQQAGPANYPQKGAVLPIGGVAVPGMIVPPTPQPGQAPIVVRQ